MKLGVQSFTMMKDIMQDLHGTLKKIQSMGFRYIEWIARVTPDDPGIGLGLSPKEAVALFQDYGLELTGCIFGSENPRELIFDMDMMQKIIDWYREAGCSAIGLANDYFVDADFFKRRMDAYNEIGRRCQDAGMSWVYHNHFHEQQKLDGKTILELMAESTIDAVGFDWDVYWGVRGLVDPVAFIKKYGKKIKRFHCKDYPFSKLDTLNAAKMLPETELVNWDNKSKYSAYQLVTQDDFTECGRGFIKWYDVIAAANQYEIPYMFVEQDYTDFADKFESLDASKQYLLRLEGISLE